MEYKNDDYILVMKDESPEVEAVVHKYDAFLDAITDDKFEHVREAVRKAVRFFISQKYTTTEMLARENYSKNTTMQAKYPEINKYLAKIQILDKKAVSIDLATGTGKSWVIYGVAQILLSEGFVDKVLVLCPSLTIEDELRKKFINMSGSVIFSRILQELGSLYPTPGIKSANDPILVGDICVENIHAVYERTGTSIRDSFLGKGKRTLVISDEAHHIYSPDDSGLKRWFEFLINPEFGFKYHLGLTGTPYIQNINNDYFHDVIYRYGIRKGMEDGIIKTIDYVLERAFEDDENQYDETYTNHKRLQKKYDGILKPITIVVTATIFECIKEWKTIVDYVARKEHVSLEVAAKKVIWVTSGLPANKEEKAAILAEFPEVKKIRKENLLALKSVDDPDNAVEWIISVAMLTEGWDVKNVFQIVPHSSRAFNSKLLIAQVLGRGLRIPNGLMSPIQVIVNNHTSWTDAIKNLYKEVIEVQNRVAWGYDKRRISFDFPLFNLEYKEEQYTVESKKKSASEPTIQILHPQDRKHEQQVTYSQAGVVRYEIASSGIVEIEDAACQIKLFLKEKDPALSEKWPLSRIKNIITEALNARGYDSSFVSNENIAIVKQGFGPMFRAIGKEVPRIRLKAHTLVPISIKNMEKQYFSEDAIKRNGYLFYDEKSLQGLNAEEKSIISEYIKLRNSISDIRTVIPEMQFLVDHLFPIGLDEFKTPLNFVYVSYGPERDFLLSFCKNSNLFDSFIKSPDKYFYSIPYSYKPTELGSTHIKRASFNPDFFLMIADSKDILVIEIKSDGDTTQQNRAKYRDANEHFIELNKQLKENKINWQYNFYFLSPENYADFFQAIRSNSYKDWKSELMQGLE